MNIWAQNLNTLVFFFLTWRNMADLISPMNVKIEYSILSHLNSFATRLKGWRSHPRLNSRGFGSSGRINQIPRNSVMSQGIFFHPWFPAEPILPDAAHLLLLADYPTARRLLLLFRQVYFGIISDLHIVPQDILCLHLSLSLQMSLQENSLSGEGVSCLGNPQSASNYGGKAFSTVLIEAWMSLWKSMINSGELF